MTRSILIMLFALMLVSCAAPVSTPTSITVQPTQNAIPFHPQVSALASSADNLTPAPAPLVPAFEHIVLILFENKSFETVIQNPVMPTYNRMAQEYTLLTQFYAVGHPSLPNYIALIGGDTFGIDKDCNDCYIDAPSLPDLIEASGLSWKTYQENMPWRCYLGTNLLSRVFKNRYAKKHNPFVYFDSIRLDRERCERSVVPITALSADIQADSLPNFIFITPNMCNIGHDCSLDIPDKWLENLLDELIPALDATGQPYLVVLTFDEGKGNKSCCGLPEEAGGRIPVVLISPSTKNAFQDDTPYSHYSLLKTIAESWGLVYLGHAADEETVLITAPWK
jgi:hypothetical protein